MTSLRLIPLDDAVIFPGMPVQLTAETGDDTRVMLIPRQGSGFAKVGVVAEVVERSTRRRGGATSLLALHRGVPGAAQSDRNGILRVDVDDCIDVTPPPAL